LRVRATVILLGVICATTAFAQTPTLPGDDEARKIAEGNPGFGPLLTIEKIEIIGNERTAERLIRRALLVAEGDRLHAGDPAFQVSRFRVLALGYFSDVRLEMRKGTERGNVILTVEVAERGTLRLNRLYFGTSEATDAWLGIDVTDGNFLGTGVGVGGALVWARDPDVTGGHAQWAGRLRYFDPSLFGLPLGTHATLLFNDYVDFVRVAGEPGDAEEANFVATSSRRAGGSGGVDIELLRSLSVVADGRVERVTGDEDAWLGGAALGIERDTRADPVLTWGGDYARLVGELGATTSGREWLRAQAAYSRWKALGSFQHVLSLHVGAGVIFGDAPSFERFYVGDWNKLLPPRPLDLVVSTASVPDILGASTDPPRFGDLAASAEVQYSYRLFRRSRLIYGGDLFFGAGMMVLGNTEPGLLGEPRGTALDVTLDAGFRLDTEVGVFELTFANGIGRLPL
jgi:outer membrane protein assembly factor BamA